MDIDEKLKVAKSMKKHGGSFVKCLGEALLHADYINAAKIKNTFNDYWEKYLKLSNI